MIYRHANYTVVLIFGTETTYIKRRRISFQKKKYPEQENTSESTGVLQCRIQFAEKKTHHGINHHLFLNVGTYLNEWRTVLYLTGK